MALDPQASFFWGGAHLHGCAIPHKPLPSSLRHELSMISLRSLKSKGLQILSLASLGVGAGGVQDPPINRGLKRRKMGLQRGRGCSRPGFTPAAPPGMLPPGRRFPMPARWLRGLSSTTLTLSKEVLVTRGLVPTVWGWQASTGTAGLCAWFISARMNSAVGRCWGKARTVRFPTQSTNRTETWFAVVAYAEQLGENSAGRGTVLLVCVTEGCGPAGSHPSPCSAGLGPGMLQPRVPEPATLRRADPPPIIK